jgi:hypothetical protein
MGKIAHCLPVVVRPRLPGSTAAAPETLSQVQVAVNDVARSLVGCRREDHVAIVDLLEAAKYLSLNQQAVKATTISAWLAYHSSDGTNGIQNPVEGAMFSGAELPTARSSRLARAGEVRVRTRGLDTHVTGSRHGMRAGSCRTQGLRLRHVVRPHDLHGIHRCLYDAQGRRHGHISTECENTSQTALQRRRLGGEDNVNEVNESNHPSIHPCSVDSIWAAAARL